jgi:hypothetical protein
MRGWRARLTPLLILLACLPARPVFASTCSNPAGNEGDIIYNRDYHTSQFCNGTGWVAMGAAGGGGGGLTLISIQTASSSASLQFTSLPTSYNTLFLNCAGLLTSTNTPIYYYVGEGTGGSFAWETSSNYQIAGAYASVNNSGSGFNSGTGVSDLTKASTSQDSTSIPMSIKMYIDNVGVSGIYKMAFYTLNVYVGQEYWVSNLGYWAGDTNPITGLEVIPGSGTITSGTCSLYGMN